MTYIPRYLKKWELPRNYTGKRWDGYYSFGFGQSRDSGCLERSNFEVAWRELNKFEGVERVTENHWAAGWVQWIAIPESCEEGLKRADELMEKMEGYPVLDEDHFSNLELEEANEVWTAYYSDRERLAYVRAHRKQFDFHDLADMLGCVRGRYFPRESCDWGP